MKLFIATPMYGGQCYGRYMTSVMNFVQQLNNYNIPYNFYAQFNESLITRARNNAVYEFEQQDYTHLLFLDADIVFDAQELISLVMAAHDPKYEILAAAYPRKQIQWDTIKRAARNGVENIAQLQAHYVINTYDDIPLKTTTELVRVKEAGTGCMLIARSAFDKFKQAYPELKYFSDNTGNFGKEVVMYFQAQIDPKSQRYLSEDYQFCEYMNQIDVPTYLAPWINLTHIGTHDFQGNLKQNIEHYGNHI